MTASLSLNHHTSNRRGRRCRAFPFETAPRFLLRDRDGVYGHVFRQRVAGMGVEEVLTAPRSPWQSPYVERVIGSIRRECLDLAVIFHERYLRRLLTAYFAYYHRSRVHRSLDMDCPAHRSVQPADSGVVVEIPQVGGIHHRYERRAA